MPTLRIDNLLDDLRGLLPTDFNLPCDLGDEFADFALGNDGGGDDGDDATESAVSSLLRAGSTSSDSEDQHVAYVHLADVMKNGISNVLASKQKEASTTSKPVTIKQRLKNQKAKLNGGWRVKWSLATPTTLEPRMNYDDEDQTGERLPFKISADLRIRPRPVRSKIFLEMTYDVNIGGKESVGPRCFMGVEKYTGKVLPLIGRKKKPTLSFKSLLAGAAFSKDIFPLEFKPSGNPWNKEGWKISLFARVVTKLPSGLVTECSGCSSGAKCLRSVATKISDISGRSGSRVGKRQRSVCSSVLPLLKKQCFEFMFKNSDKHTMMWTGLPPDIPSENVLKFNPHAGQTHHLPDLSIFPVNQEKPFKENFQDLYFRRDTYGGCLVARFPFENDFTIDAGLQAKYLKMMPESKTKKTAKGIPMRPKRGLMQAICSRLSNQQEFQKKIMNHSYKQCSNIDIDVSKPFKSGFNCALKENGRCPALRCKGADEWGKGRIFSQVFYYQVEHIFDNKRAKQHSFPSAVVNSAANFVMAWGKWNQGVSNIGSGTADEKWTLTKNEKKAVYGSDAMRKLKNLLSGCNGGCPGNPNSCDETLLTAALEEWGCGWVSSYYYDGGFTNS